MGDRLMIFARDPRALLCLNLRKEWVADQREIAAALERQAWCLDEARQSGWTVLHAHEAPGRNAASRGALRGLAPKRNEAVFVVAHGAVFANDALQEALRASGARCVHVMGVGQSAALSAHAACDVRVIDDAFVELGEASADVMHVLSSEALRVPSAEIVELGTWRRERARASEG
jgi:nicotinamidase-related amidase